MKTGAPHDFGARLRAARGYMDVSQAGLAEKLDMAGASASTIKGWEAGRPPAPLVMQALVPLLAETSGLPEDFFWGREEPSSVTAAVLAELQRLGRSIDDLRGEFTRSERERDAIVQSLGEMRSHLRDEIATLRDDLQSRLAEYAEKGLEQGQNQDDEDDQKRGEDPPTP